MTQDLQYRIENIIRNAQVDDSEILFQLKQLLYETALQQSIGKDPRRIADLVDESIHQLKEGIPQYATIKSGFEELDKLIGGFSLGEFVVVGGRPTMGKTQFLINLSLHISESFPTLYVTLDLSQCLLINRFISSVSGIPAQNILQHDLEEEQKNILAQIGNEFSKRQMFIHDSGNSSVEALQSLCQKQIQENSIQVIVVDYLQLLSSCHHRKYRELEVSHISRELKNLAKDNNVCVIASSQLSRALENRAGCEGKRPLLADLRESGAIEQDADKVLFIHRPEYYGITEDRDGRSMKYLVEIIVAKNRNGCLGSFYLKTTKGLTNFLNISYKDDFSFSQERLLELEDITPY